MRSLTLLTYSSPLTTSMKKLLNPCPHGSSTYSEAPHLLTMPSAKPLMTLMTGPPSPKSSTTNTMMTATTTLLPSLRKSELSLGLLRTPLRPHATAWRPPNSLPSLQIWRDEPFPKPSLASNGPVPCEDASATMMEGTSNLDLEIQYRMEGDDIVVYPTVKVTRVAGIKHKYREDYDPTFLD